jgi:hypothetical protein
MAGDSRELLLDLAREMNVGDSDGGALRRSRRHLAKPKALRRVAPGSEPDSLEESLRDDGGAILRLLQELIMRNVHGGAGDADSLHGVGGYTPASVPLSPLTHENGRTPETRSTAPTPDRYHSRRGSGANVEFSPSGAPPRSATAVPLLEEPIDDANATTRSRDGEVSSFASLQGARGGASAVFNDLEPRLCIDAVDGCG